ncbi:MAG: GNAT family N-acetyltransferase [Bacteroidota bacterium]
MDYFPTLYSPRLILRKIEIDDIPALLKHANNKKIADRIPNLPFPYKEPQAVFRISYVVQGFKQKKRFVFAIILKETEELIGEISLHKEGEKLAQVAFWLSESYWKQGFTTEALKATLEFGLGKAGYDQIYATCRPDNPASAQVMLKNGMKQGKDQGNLHFFSIQKE